ncbi:Branched-chain amino acid ABC transporter, amino acid-binding protein [Methanosarcina horonobensis HB-1 = JCM 15518]|uniref:Branched-chain amino acid ABC transporter, amino acid-binding protein n=1 Tax=Methanosarcina horonobensis HB-1 = JCM 15518 TaxID=1434110 RepID=A0A0E3SHJ4_9EURY|nr:penicillin-binding protein activator [Methanosarcina horonobensis]AKB79253.1 Branched-chain amino acid ABC transporter, amino acid-binding protein [Methanosarcina horonobensis HB-1 = JCM 15518]
MNRKSCISICIILAILLSGCIESSGETVNLGATSESENITIGVLLPLTGSLASIGEASQVALDVSSEDINGYFSGLGSGMNVKLVVKDTESDPETALEKLKELDEMGIKIIIGPQGSDEAQAVLDYANQNGIILLSTASTAPSLAIPDDNLFRLVPDDTNQGIVLARLMTNEGIGTVIPIYRNDVWGDGLADEVEKNFKALNGTVLKGIAYKPENANHSAEVEALNEKVMSATSEHASESVAVFLCSYGEATEIFALAQNYSALSEVKWYGTDGIALNKELINDNNAASFAAAVNVSAPMYGYLNDNKRSKAIELKIEEQLGRLPESYALAAYDALWIATYVYQDPISSDNDEIIKMAMTSNTDRYHGISGWTILNENGDRESWTYYIWTVTEENGSYQWEDYITASRWSDNQYIEFER